MGKFNGSFILRDQDWDRETIGFYCAVCCTHCTGTGTWNHCFLLCRSVRMHTTCFSDSEGGGLPTEAPWTETLSWTQTLPRKRPLSGTETPWTETFPLDRDSPRQRPPRQRPPSSTETPLQYRDPFTENPLDKDPSWRALSWKETPGQRPPRRNMGPGS